MGKEIDLLAKYPKAKRNLADRANTKTDKERVVARKFGKDFFDGDRKFGYGGYNYHPKFWSEVVNTFADHWKLDGNNSLLDVGCGKGFMIYDFYKLIDNIKLYGIDISKYAIENCHQEIKSLVKVGNAKKLEFRDNEFDYIISINTIHNLDKEDCIKAIKEISRVSKKGSFITVDAYRNEDEKKRMYDWNLTAKTIMSVNEWKELFDKVDYKGDYYWFIP